MTLRPHPRARPKLVALGDDRTVADHGRVDHDALADPGALTDGTVAHGRPGRDLHVVEEHAALHPGTAPDDRTGPDDRSAGKLGVRGDHGPVQYQRLAAGRGKCGRGKPAEHQIAGSLDEGLGCAHIQPVRGVHEAHQDLAARDEAREGLTFHRYHAAGRNLVNDTPAEHVAARVDPVRHRVGGLLQERGYPPGRVERHAAEPSRVRHLDQVQGHRGVRLAVQVQLGRDVMTGQDIPVEDDDRVIRAAAQSLSRVADRPAGAEWLLLVDVGDLQAEPRIRRRTVPRTSPRGRT